MQNCKELLFAVCFSVTLICIVKHRKHDKHGQCTALYWTARTGRYYTISWQSVNAQKQRESARLASRGNKRISGIVAGEWWDGYFLFGVSSGRGQQEQREPMVGGRFIVLDGNNGWVW